MKKKFDSWFRSPFVWFTSQISLEFQNENNGEPLFEPFVFEKVESPWITNFVPVSQDPNCLNRPTDDNDNHSFGGF